MFCNKNPILKQRWSFFVLKWKTKKQPMLKQDGDGDCNGQVFNPENTSRKFANSFDGYVKWGQGLEGLQTSIKLHLNKLKLHLNFAIMKNIIWVKINY